MARRRTPSAKTPPPPPFAYWKTTPEETAGLQHLAAAFGQLTHISMETYNQRWIEPEWWGRRCAECDTFYKAERWPYCGFCRTRDPAFAA